MPTENLYTVAAIRKTADGKMTQILFNESPRIFELNTATKSGATTLEKISLALKKKTPLSLAIGATQNRINNIAAPSETDLSNFKKERLLLEQPEKPRVLNLRKFDPTTFDHVPHHLDAAIFKLCANIVPDYATAKKIFDYCAQQSCALPGPTAVTPCIPFQYVIDGCYARAHKMRRIITTKYNYCCEKVFSFANKNNDTLAVQATKWGGCCVRWWYHVAPLIRVKVKIGPFTTITLAMVIDPGMFDTPVLLSTWLAAQANTSCAANAKVSMYSIQAGSAYAPANYAGTAFSTDNSYTATDATLTAYKNLKTCP